MVEKTGAESGDGERASLAGESGALFGFARVQEQEQDYLARRRTNNAVARDEPESRRRLAELKKRESSDKEIGNEDLSEQGSGIGNASPDDEASTSSDETVGLALSGGGIRSAAFNLGVLQTMAKLGLLPHLDYLSTVSGGGYIGSCLSTVYACESKRGLADDKSGHAANPEDVDRRVGDFLIHKQGRPESDLLTHLRNHSNFLAPHNPLQIFSVPLLMVRGILSNVFCLVPILLAVALATIFYGRIIEGVISLYVFGGYGRYNVSVLWHFPFTTLAVCLSFGFVLWPWLYFRNHGSAFRERSYERYSRWFVIFLCVLAFEAHVFLTGWVIEQWGTGLFAGPAGGLSLAAGAHWLMNAADRKSTSGFRLLKLIPVMLLLGIIGVLCLWTLVVVTTHGLQVLIEYADLGLVKSGVVAPSLVYLWISPGFGIVLIAATGLAAFAGWFTNRYYDINYTSVHNFYRDRLSDAFVAEIPEAIGCASSGNAVRKNDLQLSDLVQSFGPYHLINATHNVKNQAAHSKALKGREGDVFVFSPYFIGNNRVGYCTSGDMENKSRHINLATAMAISGAAASPSMGQKKTGLAALLLSLFNVRLNYWLLNPRLVVHQGGARPKATRMLRSPSGANVRVGEFKHNRVRPRYLLDEMLGTLSDDSPNINISDGGHSENLATYELLKRGCRLIIVGDAECDGALQFPSLMNLIRIAQIDLSIRIDMEGLDDIRRGEQHFATGKIHYSGGAPGKLIYLKSSFFGARPDAFITPADSIEIPASMRAIQGYDRYKYLVAYKARHPNFPHETTADQFFDEEQFECYRALGYMTAMGALE